jgi:hypothetical protein
VPAKKAKEGPLILILIMQVGQVAMDQRKEKEKRRIQMAVKVQTAGKHQKGLDLN